jgi:hypothetical protein
MAAGAGRFPAAYEDTHKSSWILADATVFAAFAGLREDLWARLVGGFLDHGSAGAVRIESVKITTSVSTSLLRVALLPTASHGFRQAAAMNIPLSEFRNGNITELLLALPIVRALMSDRRIPRRLALDRSQLSPRQAMGLDRLLVAAESYLRQVRMERSENEAASERGRG